MKKKTSKKISVYRTNSKIEFDKIAQDIQKIQLPKAQLKNIIEKFNQVLDKHGIRSVIKDGNAVIGNTGEYTICQVLFVETIASQLEMEMLFKPMKPYDTQGNELPKH